jgi:hypothetical protein
VHQVAMPGGARAQMTFFGNRVSDASYQPHNRDFFLFRKDVGGSEWYQIFRFDVATGDVTMLTDGKVAQLGVYLVEQGRPRRLRGYPAQQRHLDFYVMSSIRRRSRSRAAAGIPRAHKLLDQRTRCR